LDASSRTIGDLIAREASLRQAAAGLRDREQDLRDRGVGDEEMSLEPFSGEERFLPPSAWEADVRTGRASLSAWRDALSAWDERQDEWDQALVEIEVEFEDD
jgi:Tfp pilus assembly protein PilX